MDIYSNDKDKKEGFFDLPKEEFCTHPQHNPPSHLYIPPGKGYRHKCPSCGKVMEVYSPNITL